MCRLASCNTRIAPVKREGPGRTGKNCNPHSHNLARAYGYGNGSLMLQYATSTRVGFWGYELPTSIGPAVPAALPWLELDVIAMVRDPFKLFLSHRLCNCLPRSNRTGMCMWVRELPVYRRWCTSSNASEDVFSVEAARPFVSNPQTRGYAGCDALSAVNSTLPCYGKQALSAISQLEIGAADLSVALAKLRLCTVVLVTERLSEAGPLLHHRLGWSFVNMSLALGNSKGGGEANGVAPVSQASFEKANYLDLQLYDTAARLFQEQLTASTSGA